VFKDSVRGLLAGACCAAVMICRSAEGMNDIVPLDNAKIMELISVHDQNATSELSLRLFPSPFEEVEIEGINGKDFAYRLDAIIDREVVDVLFVLLKYCCELRHNPDLLNDIALIRNYTESVAENIKKLKYSGKKAKKDELLYSGIQEEIARCSHFAEVIGTYKIFGLDSVFAMLGRSIYYEMEKCLTERLLWTFSCQYLELEESERLSVVALENLALHLFPKQIGCFLYRVGTPLIAHDVAIVDGMEFPDCIETAVRHFFNFVQPMERTCLQEYWNSSASPAKDKILDFFIKTQGHRKANDGRLTIRNAWAAIISKVSGLIYKRKTCESLPMNDIELKAGWSNYLKAIAYLKKDDFAWDMLRKFDIYPIKMRSWIWKRGGSYR
jgi:hypothetical protein